MMYPQYLDYKCPECKTGTMKWQAEEFHSRYTLGQHYCDNPLCPNAYQNRYRLVIDAFKEKYKAE